MIDLICTLGESPFPALIAAEWLKKSKMDASEITVHPFTSIKMEKVHGNDRYSHLDQALSERNFQVNSREAANKAGTKYPSAKKGLRRIVRDIKKERPNSKIIIDLTGGTKIMSLAAYRVAQITSVQFLQYIDGQTGQVIRFKVGESGLKLEQANQYNLRELEIDEDTWIRLIYGDTDTISNQTDLPQWLRVWVEQNNAKAVNLQHYGSRNKLTLVTQVTDSQLEVICGFSFEKWKGLLEKMPMDKGTFLSRERIIAHYARRRLELGGDFVNAYIIFPPKFWLDENDFSFDSIEANKSFAKFAGLTPLCWSERERSPFKLPDKDKALDTQNHKLDLGSVEPILISYNKEQGTLLSTNENSETTPKQELSLITTLGDQPIPVIVGLTFVINEYKERLKRSYIVTTKDREDVITRLIESHLWKKFEGIKTYKILLRDPNNINHIHSALDNICCDGELILNLTGGTTIMALSVYDWGLKNEKLQRNAAFYVHGNKVIQIA